MDRFDPWWYSCIETSSRSWEWESVERTFGISRGMVDFIARVSFSWVLVPSSGVEHEKRKRGSKSAHTNLALPHYRTLDLDR